MARRLLLAVSAYVVLALVVVGWGWLLTHPLEGAVDPVDDDIVALVRRRAHVVARPGGRGGHAAG